MLRRLVGKALWLIDSDSVRPFIWFYYMPLLAWGVYASLFMSSTAVGDVMGQPFADGWVWIQIPATLACLVGLWMRHGDQCIEEMGSAPLFRDWLGLWMQLGGHICMNQVLLAYEFAIFSLYGTQSWHVAAFGAFALTSYVIGTGILAAQCVRKLAKGMRLKKVSA